MLDFFVQIFVFTPVTKYFIHSKRFAHPKGLILSILFLLTLSAFSIYWEMKDHPPNYYRFLNVDRSASSAEITKAWKRQSLIYHPDKNPSPTAQQDFEYLKQAYDTLSDGRKKQTYDKFGTIEEGEFSSQIIPVATFYVVWAILTYLLTMGKGATDSRSWSFTALILLSILEFNMKFGRFDFGISIFSRTPIFEKLDIARRLYPSLMNGCRLIAMILFVDVEKQNQLLLTAILQGNERIIDTLALIYEKLERKKDGHSEVLPEEIRQRARKAEELLGSSNHGPPRKTNLGAENQKKGIPSFVWYIGVYLIIQYLFK